MICDTSCLVGYYKDTEGPKFILKRLENNIKSYKVNVFMRFFIEGYIEIAIAAFLQMRDLSQFGSSSIITCNL